MGKTILNTLKGAAFGAIGAVCLFIAFLFVELLNVGCAILTCDCDKPMVLTGLECGLYYLSALLVVL